MLPWIGAAARAAREARARKQVHIAATLGVDQGTIGRFEGGRAWPRDPDKVVAAYAEDLDMDPLEIWEAAVAEWAAGRKA
jgi:transcriptional regulator with XRE-family HTH domain